MDARAKLDELLTMVKLDELIGRKKQEKSNPILWILAIVGAVAAVAGIAFLVYRYLSPAYEEDFYDFDDDFDDFEDDIEELKEDIKEAKEDIKELKEKSED